MLQENFIRSVSPSELQKESLCYSDGMGFQDRPTFYINRSGFNNYLIMYTVYGRLWVHQNGEKIAVNQGESILMDLHDPHIYYFDENIPSKIAWLHLNGHPATKVITSMKKYHSLPVISSNSVIYDKLISLFEISNQPDQDVFAQSEYCYSLLMEFMREEWTHNTKTSETSAQIEFKNNVWQYISHNLHRDITLDELAASVSLSKFHFLRTFHNAFGISPMQFITEEKIRQAKYQLLNTKEPVFHISESLGFSTPSYFSKVFKHVTGFSPSDYRKYAEFLTEY